MRDKDQGYDRYGRMGYDKYDTIGTVRYGICRVGKDRKDRLG